MQSALSAETLRLALDEHDILLQFTEEIRRLFDHGVAAEPTKAVGAMGLLLGTKIPEHFTREEENVFSPLQASHPDPVSAGIVVELTTEHQTLLKQVEELQQLLAQPDAVRLQENALWSKLVSFLTQLEKHAEKEDQLFHSLLGDDIPPSGQTVRSRH
jgi:hemerythrin-like domain-containing protein